MKRILITIALLANLALPLFSQAIQTGTGSVQAQASPTPTKHRHYYKNKDGQRVPSPERSNAVPAGATAPCKDGSYSFSKHHSGTCNHHGGVARWLAY